MIAIDKPAGLLVHRTALDRRVDRVAVQMLRDQIGQRVHPAHRLDRPTSGVLLFALSRTVVAALGDAFSDRRVDKTYLAVVRGWPDDAGEIDYPIADDDGPVRPAVTRFECIARGEVPFAVDRHPTTRYALLEVRPVHGRRHQIRRHLRHISHPIIGDVRYGKGPHNRHLRDAVGVDRLLLHCASLGFEHPITKAALRIEAPIDADFERAAAHLRLQMPGPIPSDHLAICRSFH